MDKESLVTEEQLVGLSNNDATHIAKGKRTKRLRLLSPFGVNVAAAATTVMTSSCSSANSSGDYGSFSSTTTTTYESTDQEEEDMANCLILLAQGSEGGGGGGDSHHHQKQQQGENHDHDDGNKKEKGSSTSSRKFAEMATATNTKVGFFIYECKTCNRTFPSFQALGGHRASHKKPKLMPEEKKPSPSQPSQPPPPPPSSQPQVITNYDKFEEAGGQPHIKSGPPISLQLGSHGHRGFHGNKAKIHECSICGSEFTSGQALGGHMRRHRASTNTATTTTTQVVGMMSGIEISCNTTVAAAAVNTQAVEVQPRNILELDLNLPAPEEDLREPKFQFTATQKSMVLSAAPALVDCHY